MTRERIIEKALNTVQDAMDTIPSDDLSVAFWWTNFYLGKLQALLELLQDDGEE